MLPLDWALRFCSMCFPLIWVENCFQVSVWQQLLIVSCFMHYFGESLSKWKSFLKRWVDALVPCHSLPGHVKCSSIFFMRVLQIGVVTMLGDKEVSFPWKSNRLPTPIVSLIIRDNLSSLASTHKEFMYLRNYVN